MEFDVATLIQLGSTVALGIGAVFAYRWSSAKLDAEATEKITNAAKTAVDLVQGSLADLRSQVKHLEREIESMKGTEHLLRRRIVALELEVKRLGGDPSKINGRGRT